MPDDPVGAAWRLADLLREFRGDAHTAAWTAAGFDAVEIGLATEQYWGVPPRSYVRTRAWSTADLDAAETRLDSRGLMAAGLLTDCLLYTSRRHANGRSASMHPWRSRTSVGWTIQSRPKSSN